LEADDDQAVERREVVRGRAGRSQSDTGGKFPPHLTVRRPFVDFGLHPFRGAGKEVGYLGYDRVAGGDVGNHLECVTEPGSEVVSMRLMLRRCVATRGEYGEPGQAL